jgi:hypothetical protein
LDRRHSLQLLVSDRIHPNVVVSAIGQLGSGLPFTPLVAGDVNGDHALNDRAFVFDPASADDGVTQGMQRLLEAAPGTIRHCLRYQLGTIAGRNSCRTSWWSTLNLQAQIAPAGMVASRRLAFTVTASNMTAGLDYLLHGADGLRGWGQFPLPDPFLLEVRGFDPERGVYRYQVNPRFGQPFVGSSMRVPFQLTLQARFTVGADPRYQPMVQMVESMRQTVGGPAQIRARLAERIRNVPATLLALDASDPGELGLTPSQVQRLRAAADSLEPKVESSLAVLSEAFSHRGPITAVRQARIQEGARSAQSAVEQGIEAVRKLLSPEQWVKIPAWLVRPAPSEDFQRPPPFKFNISAGG